MKNKFSSGIILILIIFIIIVLFLSCWITTEPFENQQTIPKIIWTFWE